MKPMLAGTLKHPEKLRFPIYVQPKLDGIRAMVVDGKLLSRTLKPIPNKQICAILERPEYEGFDGELIVGSPTADDCYRKTVSFVMAEDKIGEDFTFFVFDLWNDSDIFALRDHRLRDRVALGGRRVWHLTTETVHSQDELDSAEARFIELGYEGAILRAPSGLYKFGRGTESKQDLLKLKRFTDAEAVVIGVEEEMANTNVAFKNELGRTARSSEKAGKVGKSRLGALICRTPEGAEFKIGTGFNHSERLDLWHDQGVSLNGKIAKYKSFPVGVKDKPRHPVFLGWRDPRDMS